MEPSSGGVLLLPALGGAGRVFRDSGQARRPTYHRRDVTKSLGGALFVALALRDPFAFKVQAPLGYWLTGARRYASDYSRCGTDPIARTPRGPL